MFFGGTLDAIRTRGLSLRRRTLYPAELQGHIRFFVGSELSGKRPGCFLGGERSILLSYKGVERPLLYPQFPRLSRVTVGKNGEGRRCASPAAGVTRGRFLGHTSVRTGGTKKPSPLSHLRRRGSRDSSPSRKRDGSLADFAPPLPTQSRLRGAPVTPGESPRSTENAPTRPLIQYFFQGHVPWKKSLLPRKCAALRAVRTARQQGICP